MKLNLHAILKVLSISIIISCYAHSGMAQACPDSIYTGTATFYSAQSVGNCSFPVPAAPMYVASINAGQYNSSATCGACIQVTGKHGDLILSIEDQCPTCPANGLDLSTTTDSILSDSTVTPQTVQWRYVGCPVSGPAQVILTSSNAYYIQLQVRNHRYPVQMVEYKSGSTQQYFVMTRTSNNYFEYTTSFGSGPYEFRITDILGDQVEAIVPSIVNDNVMDAQGQFPACVATGIKERNIAGQLMIHNNPSADGRFILENRDQSDVPYSISDVSGREIATGTVIKQTSSEIKMPSQGVYILYSSSAGKMASTKLVVQ